MNILMDEQSLGYMCLLRVWLYQEDLDINNIT